MRFFFVSSHTNNRREPSNKNNIKGMQQQSVDVDRKEPSTQVHKSLSHRETMLRHYYNQFLFILQFSVNFSSLSSLSMMWCGVLCCNNNDDVPFLWHLSEFFLAILFLLIHKMQFELGSKEEKAEIAPNLCLEINDVLKSRMSCDGLAFISAKCMLMSLKLNDDLLHEI